LVAYSIAAVSVIPMTYFDSISSLRKARVEVMVDAYRVLGGDVRSLVEDAPPTSD